MRGVVSDAARCNVTWALLDRDGTINEKPPEGDYVRDAKAVRLVAGAGAAVRRLNEALQAVVVVTNQRGVARGLFTEADVADVNSRLNALLADAGGRIDHFFVCPHEDGECSCRKPAPGLLYTASEQFGLSLDRAVLIGDTETDIAAGNAVGALTIRLAGSGTASRANHVAPGISGAVDLVLAAGT
jgi:D-glycero-D-manno-heptose 1,7-bisphosphate phosphatase